MYDRHDNRLATLIDKLKSLGPLDAGDVAAIDALPVREERPSSGARIVSEGARVAQCCVLLSGYACRSKRTSEGRRQIVSFHIPGDILDLQHLLLEVADHNVEMITDAAIAWIPVQALRTLAREHPNVGTALWRDTLIEASIFREWVLNVGQRDGRARIAHMLCEFAFRRAVAGQGELEELELPITPQQIADATGMTTIHVNRMLRALREEGVIRRENSGLEITDWDGIRRVAGFRPAYLHPAAP